MMDGLAIRFADFFHPDEAEKIHQIAASVRARIQLTQIQRKTEREWGRKGGKATPTMQTGTTPATQVV